MNLPCWQETTDLEFEEGTCDVAIIWPWDVLHWLWNEGKFFSWVVDNQAASATDQENLARQAVSTYWNACRHLDFFGRLELSENDLSKTVPIFFHTDGVKVYKAQKAWVYSYSSATRKGPSIQTKLVSLLIRESLVIKHKTHDSIGLLHGYICDVLQTGKFPSLDSQGKPWNGSSPEYVRANSFFAGGWKLAFAGFKSDWEARKDVHRLARNYQCTQICEHCLASRRPDFTFGDFRLDAAYRNHMFTHEEFLMVNGAQPSWCSVKGWTKDRNLEDIRRALVGFVFFGRLASSPKTVAFAYNPQSSPPVVM